MNVVDNSGLRRYRTELPNMLLDDERIGPYELALFAHYKRRAGDTGACFETNASVARHTNMSVAKVKQARIILAHAGYITIQKKTGAPTTITIVDRWGENMSRYGVATTKPPPSKVATSWPGVATTKPGGGYHVATEEEPSKKNQEEEDREDQSTHYDHPDPKMRRAVRATAPTAGTSKLIDEPFIEELIAEFADVLGGAQRVRERIEAALNHKASDKWKNKRLGVRTWLRRDAATELERRSNGRRTTYGGDNGGARPADKASPYGTWADVAAEQEALGFGRPSPVRVSDDDDV